jgi:hypothetical protein
VVEEVMTKKLFATGARPSPRHRLAAATPHEARTDLPPQFLVVPSVLSYWLNNSAGDCVTAEEAFAKACSGILISDDTVLAWATANNVLNGADLDQVLQLMQFAGFSQDGDTLNDGPATSVDWTAKATLQSAISQGPVKIGVAAAQLQALQGTTTIGVSNGWLATGFSADPNMDHCVSLCGYGTIAWLAEGLGVAVPAGVDGTSLGYALFTWKSIGIIDEPSMLAITSEAWLRSPTTNVIGTGAPTLDAVTTFPTLAPPAPTPTAPPAPVPTAPPSLLDAQAAVSGALSALGQATLDLTTAQETANSALAPLWPPVT